MFAHFLLHDVLHDARIYCLAVLLARNVQLLWVVHDLLWGLALLVVLEAHRLVAVGRGGGGHPGVGCCVSRGLVFDCGRRGLPADRRRSLVDHKHAREFGGRVFDSLELRV